MGADMRDARGVAVATLLCVFTMAPFLVLPLVISVISRAYDASGQEIGLFGMAVMFGGPVGGLITMLLVRKVAWPRFARLLLIGFCLGLLAATRVNNFVLLAATLSCVGVMGGSAYSLGLSALSDTAQPGRAFGICIAAQVALQVAGMLAMPLYATASVDVLFASFLLPCLLLVPVMHWLPKRKPNDDQQAHALLPRFDVATSLALSGCFLFFLNVGIVWTYVEPLGSSLGFSVGQLAIVLAAGVSIGVLGALSTDRYLSRHSEQSASALVATGGVMSIGLMLFAGGIWVFALGVAIYNLVWNFGLGQQYTTVARLDRSGRALALVPAVQGLGGAIGPAIAGLAAGTASNYRAILAPAIIAAIWSSVMLWLALTRVRPATPDSPSSLRSP